MLCSLSIISCLWKAQIGFTGFTVEKTCDFPDSPIVVRIVGLELFVRGTFSKLGTIHVLNLLVIKLLNSGNLTGRLLLFTGSLQHADPSPFSITRISCFFLKCRGGKMNTFEMCRQVGLSSAYTFLKNQLWGS